jgi:hypothetical protein
MKTVKKNKLVIYTDSEMVVTITGKMLESFLILTDRKLFHNMADTP